MDCNHQNAAPVVVRVFSGGLHHLHQACEDCALSVILRGIEKRPVGLRDTFIFDAVKENGEVISLYGSYANTNLTDEQAFALFWLAQNEKECPPVMAIEDAATLALIKLDRERDKAAQSQQAEDLEDETEDE